MSKACDACKLCVESFERKIKIRFEVAFFFFLVLNQKCAVCRVIREEVVVGAGAARCSEAPEETQNMNAAEKTCHALLIFSRRRNMQSQFSMCLESARGKYNIICVYAIAYREERRGVSLVSPMTLTIPKDVGSPGACLSRFKPTASVWERRLQLGKPPKALSIKTQSGATLLGIPC